MVSRFPSWPQASRGGLLPASQPQSEPLPAGHCSISQSSAAPSTAKHPVSSILAVAARRPLTRCGHAIAR